MLSNEAKEYIKKIVKEEIENVTKDIKSTLEELEHKIYDLKVDLKILKEGDNI